MNVDVFDASHKITQRGVLDTSTVTRQVSKSLSLGGHHLPNGGIAAAKGNLHLDNVHGQSNVPFIDTPTSELLVRSSCTDTNILLPSTESLATHISRIDDLDVVQFSFLGLEKA